MPSRPRACAAPACNFRAWLLAALGCALAVPLASYAAQPVDLSSPVGLWAPLDWTTGKPMGLIRIYEQSGELYGRIEPTGDKEDEGKRCTRCTDERRNKPYNGLVLMRHLRLQNGEYVGGDILDPGTGSIYGCKLRLIDGGHRLIMRGFLGISLLGRSQTWQRVES
jgi:uncharacterized protein (DUF2147 family)